MAHKLKETEMINESYNSGQSELDHPHAMFELDFNIILALKITRQLETSVNSWAKDYYYSGFCTYMDHLNT